MSLSRTAFILATLCALAVLPGAALAQTMDGSPGTTDLLLAIASSTLFLGLAVWAVVERARFQEAARYSELRARCAEALNSQDGEDFLVLTRNGRAAASEGLRERLGLGHAIENTRDLSDTNGNAGLSPADLTALRRYLSAPDGDQAPERLLFRPLAGGALNARAIRRQIDGEPVLVLTFEDTAAGSPDAGPANIEAPDASALQAFAAQAPFPVWVRGTNLDLTWVNSAYIAAVGAENIANILANQTELTREALSGSTREAAGIALKEGLVHRERRNAVIGGERRAVEIVDIPLGGGDGVLGYAADFTDEERVRSELHLYTESYAETLDRLLTPVAIFSAQQELEFFNSAFAELWQLPEDWLREMPAHGEILDRLRDGRRLPEQADFPAWKRRVLSQYTDVIEAAEEMWHLPDGRTLRVLTQPHPLGGLLLLFDDVTDRLALERSYNTLIAVQRETLENLHEAVVVVGADGRVKLFNRNFAEIWQIDEALLESEPHIGAVLDGSREILAGPEEDWDEVRSQLLGHMISRKAANGRTAQSDGRITEFASVPLPDGATLFTLVDITASVRIEQALRERTEALEEADQIKSQFVANMSYELRTPLNSIRGFTELLAGDYAGALSAKQREYTDAILQASGSLEELINNILDLAVLEAGQAELELEEVDINALVERAKELVTGMSGGRRIEIATTETDQPILVCDGRRIVQALFNILSNAIAFSPDGGRVTVAVDGDDRQISVRVADQGQGIAEDDQPRIFDKFVRGTTPEGRTGRSGVGLGLALVKSFVSLHGGDVVIESRTGQGTEVTCVLPRSPAEPRTAADGD